MGASTEMARLDNLPKETLDALMELVEIGAAEKLNNMESGIVSGQNNVEFVKIFSELSLYVSGNAKTSSSGGPFAEGKTLGEVVNNKKIVALTSKFSYGTTGVMYPLQTLFSWDLWDQDDHINDVSAGIFVDWGAHYISSEEPIQGKLDVYAICI